MACRTVLRCVFLTEPWKPSLAAPAPFSLSLAGASSSPPRRKLGCGYRPPRDPGFHSARRSQVLNCSTSNGSPSSSGNWEDDQEQGPPQEAVLKAISEVSKAEGRVGQTTNVVIGGTVSDDSTSEWLALDKKGRVRQKSSSRGKYVSVNIGPIHVVSSEQVQAVYNAMRRDERMKYFL
ncbi:uncharacterized protein LOC115749357 isoform X3 [Rhodamnia argentea]|uniref:Uncharacterized protein LOC115749357 isoform X3 n=1 Tax=Rhodamnia argentea TaxID=178133 RepID=A0ABM3HLD2_9MYRT|nr:uncharacterized protein LOC115749357 isoform X3 [Rhodamnia argentea]